jgi:hypothetical protein
MRGMMGIKAARPLTFTGWALRLAVLAGIGGAAAIWLSMQPPIAQDPAYHNFADQRTLLGIPHFWNVVSNAPFLVIGLIGLWYCALGAGSRGGDPFVQPVERLPYLLLFLGVTLTAFGSSYYHLHPDNERLVWDRLPMALGFTALCSGLLIERVGMRLGLVVFPLLIAAGIGSVLYWKETGDLRPYYFVQFFPLAGIPLLVVLFPARYTGTGYLLLAIFWYVLAKFCEHPLDHWIYRAGHLLSGHTLKHLLAAVGIYYILRMLTARKPVPAPSEPALV